mgnify:CR=1 FL=1|tara:strand:- start:37 stop:378 length:342 start_codon:yes stop_codon:yes gene_type:complete
MTNKDKKFFDSIRDKLTTNTDKIKSKLIELKDLLANESAETQEMLGIYRRYVSGEKIDKETMEKANEQFTDLLKSLGLAGIFALPGGILAIAFLVKVGKVLNIDILPKKTFDD